MAERHQRRDVAPVRLVLTRRALEDPIHGHCGVYLEQHRLQQPVILGAEQWRGRGGSSGRRRRATGTTASADRNSEAHDHQKQARADEKVRDEPPCIQQGRKVAEQQGGVEQRRAGCYCSALAWAEGQAHEWFPPQRNRERCREAKQTHDGKPPEQERADHIRHVSNCASRGPRRWLPASAG